MEAVKRVGLLVCVALMMAVFASPALGAFPGRDGLLAVQPLHGTGIVLVMASGRGERLVQPFIPELCTGCGPSSRLLRPEWSPDGRDLLVEAVTAGATAEVATEDALIYPDGSCLDCRLPVLGADAVFTDDPTLFTATSLGSLSRGPELTEYGIDGLWRGTLLSPSARCLRVGVCGRDVSEAAWSLRGELAVVHAGQIWVGRLPWLRPLAAGSSPSWSPDGSQIVFERAGWLWVERIQGHSFRRLVGGKAPSWSPDGRWIAFFDQQHRLSVVAAKGGRVRHVGGVTGRTVDWQPLPATAPVACPTPSAGIGQQESDYQTGVRARNDTATVTWDNVHQPSLAFVSGSTWSLIACLRANGRDRVLESGGHDFEGATDVSQVALAGTFAGVVLTGGGKYCDGFGQVELFDLRTGEQIQGRGGENVPCGGGSVYMELVLGSDAVSAVHSTTQGSDSSGNPCSCGTEQIQASDSAGVHTLDSVTQPQGSPPALTNLTLTGDSLTWQHNGSLRSAQLQP